MYITWEGKGYYREHCWMNLCWPLLFLSDHPPESICDINKKVMLCINFPQFRFLSRDLIFRAISAQKCSVWQKRLLSKHLFLRELFPPVHLDKKWIRLLQIGRHAPIIVYLEAFMLITLKTYPLIANWLAGWQLGVVKSLFCVQWFVCNSFSRFGVFPVCTVIPDV